MFIAILVVALLAYGVTSQSLMFPSREPYIGIFKDIFYYPYWQTYGELFLEDITGRGPHRYSRTRRVLTGSKQNIPIYKLYKKEPVLKPVLNLPLLVADLANTQ